MVRKKRKPDQGEIRFYNILSGIKQHVTSTGAYQQAHGDNLRIAIELVYALALTHDINAERLVQELHYRFNSTAEIIDHISTDDVIGWTDKGCH